VPVTLPGDSWLVGAGTCGPVGGRALAARSPSDVPGYAGRPKRRAIWRRPRNTSHTQSVPRSCNATLTAQGVGFIRGYE